ncbi:unnamed protein product [Effrenium voratum]|nr:unnamed protein product [Effrenium voratum]
MASLLFALALIPVNAEVPEIGAWTPQEEVSTTTSSRVLQLNSVLFSGNALQPMGGGAEQWVVAFCPTWWEPCQQLQVHLDQLAGEWQGKLNAQDSFFERAVRFAFVDCASEKASGTDRMCALPRCERVDSP